MIEVDSEVKNVRKFIAAPDESDRGFSTIYIGGLIGYGTGIRGLIRRIKHNLIKLRYWFTGGDYKPKHWS